MNIIHKIDDCKYSLEAVKEQIVKPETLGIIRKITGNTQISRTELANLVPIDVL